METTLEKAKENVENRPKKENPLRDYFRRFAQTTAAAVGSAWAFIIAFLVIVAWAITGPLFKFSDTWQLVINTGTTIVTFLMVFLIQNTQNRDARAIHLKLDELLRGVKGARTHMVDLENCTDEELDEMEKEFHRLRQRTTAHRQSSQKRLQTLEAQREQKQEQQEKAEAESSAA